MATTERGKDKRANPSARGHPYHGPFSHPGRRTYADLADDPRVRRWARRGGIALGVGLVATLVFDIQVGLVLAVLAVIADAFTRARLHSSVDAWRRPSAAERKTEHQLRALAKSGYHTLHARAVPRDDENVSDGKIDHLVIGPTGVYAIDSEKWDKRLPLRAAQNKLYLGPSSKEDRLDEARWEAKQASKLISRQLGFKVQVQPSLAIYGPAISWKILSVRNVDVYAGARARRYLSRRPRVLSDNDVERVARVAEEVIPPIYQE